MTTTAMTTDRPAAGEASPGVLGRFFNPHATGIAIGVLSWVVFAVVDKPLGISTSISAASGLCAAPVIGMDGVSHNAYWAKHAARWDYGMLFLVGTFLGAFFSALVGRNIHAETVPTVWQEHFGSSKLKRFFAAFVGGVLILFGARLAGGCTSGHGISGSLQLALSGWTFFLTMFASGVVTAFVMFRRKSA